MFYFVKMWITSIKIFYLNCCRYNFLYYVCIIKLIKNDMKNTFKKTREELQYEITCNNRLHTSVQSVERFKAFHFANYIKYFADKEEGFIYNKMNANGTWSFRWFALAEEAVDFMNGMTISQIKAKRKL